MMLGKMMKTRNATAWPCGENATEGRLCIGRQQLSSLSCLASPQKIEKRIDRRPPDGHDFTSMKTAKGITVIANGQMIDGTGMPPVPNATLVVQDGKIKYVGPTEAAPAIPSDALH